MNRSPGPTPCSPLSDQQRHVGPVELPLHPSGHALRSARHADAARPAGRPARSGCARACTRPGSLGASSADGRRRSPPSPPRPRSRASTCPRSGRPASATKPLRVTGTTMTPPDPAAAPAAPASRRRRSRDPCPPSAAHRARSPRAGRRCARDRSPHRPARVGPIARCERRQRRRSETRARPSAQPCHDARRSAAAIRRSVDVLDRQMTVLDAGRRGRRERAQALDLARRRRIGRRQRARRRPRPRSRAAHSGATASSAARVKLRSVLPRWACSSYASTIRCTSLCRTTSSPPKRTNSMPSTASSTSPTTISPDCCSRGRSTWVTSPVTTIREPKPETRQEHLHLLGRRVLRLVEDHERVVQRTSAHERERRDLDHAALEVLGDLLGVEHVVQRVEQRAQVGIDLRHQIARQEPQPLARLHRRARQDDAVDLVARQRRRRHRHREKRLARARRARSRR